MTGFPSPIRGAFSVIESGNNLDLRYSAVPEPATPRLLAAGAAGGAVANARRRRERRHITGFLSDGIEFTALADGLTP